MYGTAAIIFVYSTLCIYSKSVHVVEYCPDAMISKYIMKSTRCTLQPSWNTVLYKSTNCTQCTITNRIKKAF